MFGYKPKAPGIKPFNPITQERQMAGINRETAAPPNQFAHTIVPHVQPIEPVKIPQAGQPSGFNRLRAMFAGGK